MPTAKRRGEDMDESTSRKRQNTAGPSGPVVMISSDDPQQEVALRPVKTEEVVEVKSDTPVANGAQLGPLQRLQSDFDSLRNNLTCRICERLFYEPYVLSCGHTYCYRCLSTWFDSKRKATCPNCRVHIKQTPAPSYAIKEMAQIFAARIELLPEGETIEDHETWRKEEADYLIAERDNKDARHGGLFKGKFNEGRRAATRPVVDPSDQVARCPNCHWEIEDDMCLHCGVHFGSEGESDSDDSEDYESDIDDFDDLDGENDVDDPDLIWGEQGNFPPYTTHRRAHEDALRQHRQMHYGGMPPWRGRMIYNPDEGWMRPDYEDAYRYRSEYHGEGEEDEEEGEEDYDSEDDDEEGSLNDFVVNDHSEGTRDYLNQADPSSHFSDSVAPASGHTNRAGRRIRRIVVDDDDDEDDEEHDHDMSNNATSSVADDLDHSTSHSETGSSESDDSDDSDDSDESEEDSMLEEQSGHSERPVNFFHDPHEHESVDDDSDSNLHSDSDSDEEDEPPVPATRGRSGGRRIIDDEAEEDVNHWAGRGRGRRLGVADEIATITSANTRQNEAQSGRRANVFDRPLIRAGETPDAGRTRRGGNRGR